MNEEQTMQLILPASDIPLEANVTKRTGEKLYLLRDRIRVFGAGEKPLEIRAEGSSRFLVGDRGDANVVDGDTQLVWHLSLAELARWVEEQIEGTPQ